MDLRFLREIIILREIHEKQNPQKKCGFLKFQNRHRCFLLCAFAIAVSCVVCLRYRCFLWCAFAIAVFCVLCAPLFVHRCCVCVRTVFCGSLSGPQASKRHHTHAAVASTHTMSSAKEMAKVIGMCYSRDLKALAAASKEQDSERCFFKFKDTLKLGNADLEDHVFFLEQLLVKDDLVKTLANFCDAVIVLDAEYEGRLSGTQCEALLGHWASTVAARMNTLWRYCKGCLGGADGETA